MEPLKGEPLIRLLDDPDLLVFEAVSEKIQQLGPGLLPDLEEAARKAMSPILHERIEQIIRILQFTQLKYDFSAWIYHPAPRLVEGAWLMLRYQFPDLGLAEFTALLKPLRDEIWLEISDTLTAIEKIRVFNTIFFSKQRIYLNESHPESPGNNFINRIIETGKSNEHSMNLLYAIIGQELEIPLFVVEMPDYPILAYVDIPVFPVENLDPDLFDVLFYINTADNGSLHSRDDITNYLISQSLPRDPNYYKPMTNPSFIKICLTRLAGDYRNSGSEIRASQIEDLLTVWK